MPDAVFIVAGTIIKWAAVVLVAFVLFSGPFIRRFLRRRCPKCWYDMSHTEGRRCPECGRVAKRERQLRRLRRRWIVVLGACVVASVGHFVYTVPAVRERGPVAAVPTTVLVVVAPWLRPDLARACSVGWAGQPLGSWTDQLYADLLAIRLRKQKLWWWQERLLMLTCVLRSRTPLDDWVAPADWLVGHTQWADGLGQDSLPWRPYLSDFRVATRSSWSTEAPVALLLGFRNSYPAGPAGWPGDRVVGHEEEAHWRVTIRRHGDPIVMPIVRMRSDTEWWDDGVEEVTIPDPGTYEVVVELRQRDELTRAVRYHEVMRRTVTLGPPETLDDELPADARDGLFDRALRRSLDPAIVRTADRRIALDLGLGYYELAELLDGIPLTTFAFRADVLRGEEVVATAQAWYARRRSVTVPAGRYLPLTIHAPDAFEPESSGTPLELRLRSDPTMALHDFDSPQYWEGEVRVPIQRAE